MKDLSKYSLALVALVIGVAAVGLHAPGFLEYLIGGKGGALLPALAVAWAIGLALAWAAPKIGIAFAGFGSAGANAYLFWHKIAAAGEDPVCTVDNYMDCGAVNDSAYSEFLGVPITLVGAGLYLGIGLASLAKDEPVKLYRSVAWLMVPSLVYCLVLSGVAYFDIKALCVFCMSIYVGSVALMVASLRGLAKDGEPMGSLTDLTSGGSALTIGGATIAVTVLGMLTSTGSETDTFTADADGLVPVDMLASLYMDVDVELQLAGNEPVLGNPDAPYTIVEWADFGCPHCAHAAEELEALIEGNDSVQLRFKPFPLSGDCREMVVDGVVSDPRCRGAVATECAHRQGKFWPVAHAVFTNLGYLELSDLRFHAESKGLDVDAWDRCMEDPSAVEAVAAHAEAGRAAGVSGTPALFILGLRDEPVKFMSGQFDRIGALVEAHEAGRTLPPGTATP